MKLGKIGFRALCGRIIALPSNYFLHLAAPSIMDADALLLYGYNDPEYGLFFLAFGTAIMNPWCVVSTTVENEILIPLKVIYHEEVKLIGTFVTKSLQDRVDEKLVKFNPSKQVQAIRELGFLDVFRNPLNPDVVRLPFRDTGIQVDVRLDDIQGYSLQGILHNQTAYRVGKEKGDRVCLRLHNMNGKFPKAFVDDVQ